MCDTQTQELTQMSLLLNQTTEQLVTATRQISDMQVMCVCVCVCVHIYTRMYTYVFIYIYM